jgi:hypothetical protein
MAGGEGGCGMMEELVKLIPREICNRSGKVFYSGRAAFSEPNDLYILGYNPGDDPSSPDESTIDYSILEMLKINDAHYSSFMDERWKGHPPGTFGIQPRVLHMFRAINRNPRKTPASNLIFVRSKGQGDLEREVRRLEELCWPFHEAVIQQLGIKVVLCMGKATGDRVKRQVGARERVGCFKEQYPVRKNKSEAFRSRNGLIVVSATHPSRAKWDTPEADPSPLVKAVLDRNYNFDNC